MWAVNRYNGSTGKYEGYTRYEDDPVAVYTDVKAFIESNENNEDISPFMDLETALYPCAVLMRDFHNQLDESQILFCKNVILKFGTDLVNNPISILSATYVAAIVCEIARMASVCEFKPEWGNPWFVLLALAVCYCKYFQRYFDFSELLWNNKPDTAKRFIASFVQIVSKCSSSNIYGFFENNKKEISNAFSTPIDRIENINIDGLDYNAILFIHLITVNHDENATKFVINNGQKIWGALFDNDRSNSDIRNNIYLESSYKEWLANFALNISDENRAELVQSIMTHARPGHNFSVWLSDLICAEDIHPRYDSFWNLWQLMQEYIIKWYDNSNTKYTIKATDFDSYSNVDEVIMNYLLAFQYWREGTEQWHTLRQENNTFYYSMSQRVGHVPTTLFSIARILNTIGKNALKDYGIDWISNIIKNNPHLSKQSLPINTIYYIEEYIFWFTKEENFTLKSSDIDVKKKVLTILDFLINQGSTVGFLLRDKIV